MRNKKLTKSEGFTIIEVLIVLAIAGLILLIVFLAVPALQRNSRNTQRKSDAAAVLGAVQEYINNNSGQLPANLAAFSGNYKVGFYTGANDVAYTLNTSAVTSFPTATDKITINTYSKCSGNSAFAAAGNVTSRNATAVYYVETTGAPQAQCQDM